MEPLVALTDQEEKRIIVGRKRKVFEREGFRGSLFIGEVAEDGPLKGFKVYVDALYPHVIFVAGARGSGKSYTLGVFAEELVENVPYVAVVLIDPVGIYWSMKEPNKQPEELEELARWGIVPRGYNNVTIFVPEGIKDQIPPSTYDKTFSLPPSMLTPEDWCLTFGVDRFSPAGLLLEKVLEIVREEKGENYTLNDIIEVLENEDELKSKEKGFKRDTIRALLSRFYAAKSWGIFSEEGTPLEEICVAGRLSVIDISFLEENVGALVIGILARRILQERKIAARLEATGKGRGKIPPTWLIVDEAHTLVPSGGKKTPASDPLIEYVKQGRRPGCSLILATQQPSAVDTKLLSQLDILITHKLVFSDDVKAVEKRMPTVLPKEYQGAFLKRLPIGTALLGDRTETTNRAFVVRIRPRKSQHEGRELAADVSMASAEKEKEEKEKEEYEIMQADREKSAKVLVVRITEDVAKRILRGLGTNPILRIFGAGNEVAEMELKFVPVWVAEYTTVRNMQRGEKKVAYIDSLHGEFIHFKGKLVFSRGLKFIYKLPRFQKKVLLFLYANPGAKLNDIIIKGKVPKDVAEKALEELRKSRLIREEEGKYYLDKEFMLPPDPDAPLLLSLAKLPMYETVIKESEVLKPNFGKERVKEILTTLWPGTVVQRVYELYRPVWVATIVKGGREEKVILDAVTGVVEKEIPRARR